MTATGYWRGHAMHEADPGIWVYSDTGQPVASDPHRPCGHCGLPPTPEGHDGCLGTLPGVANACCRHGAVREAYVQYEDCRETVRGDDAVRAIADLSARKDKP